MVFCNILNTSNKSKKQRTKNSNRNLYNFRKYEIAYFITGEGFPVLL